VGNKGKDNIRFLPIKVGPQSQQNSGEGFLSFNIAGKEMIRIEANGEFYVRGRLVDTDVDVYIAFRDWLARASKEKS
jgi:hypothetical protein